MSKLNHYYQDKAIWIIGASAGIGEALAYHFANYSCQLLLSARNEEALKALKEKLGSKATILPLDVNEPKLLETVFTQFKEQDIHLDEIIYLPAHYEPMQLSRLDMQAVEKTIATNLSALFSFIHYALPYLTNNPHCQLSITASSAGYIGLPISQPYAATKAAAINLIESLKAEHPTLKIKLINSGFVKTRLTDKNQFAMPGIISTEEAAHHIAKGLSSKRFEIHFPKSFTLFVKLLAHLPYRLYFACIRRMRKQ